MSNNKLFLAAKDILCARISTQKRLVRYSDIEIRDLVQEAYKIAEALDKHEQN